MVFHWNTKEEIGGTHTTSILNYESISQQMNAEKILCIYISGHYILTKYIFDFVFTVCLVVKSCSTLKSQQTIVPHLFCPWYFSRQEYQRGLSFPSSGDLSNTEIEPISPALAGRFFSSEPPGKLIISLNQEALYFFSYSKLMQPEILNKTHYSFSEKFYTYFKVIYFQSPLSNSKPVENRQRLFYPLLNLNVYLQQYLVQSFILQGNV